MKKRKKILLVGITVFIAIMAFIGCVKFDLFLNPFPKKDTNTEDKNTPTTAINGVTYDELQIHFLELGNKYTGDSTYIKSGDVDILIDAGSRKSSSETIKNYIDQYCTDGKLEYVIATHAHQDHIAGFVGSNSGDTKSGIYYQYDIDTIIDFSLTGATSQLYEDYLIAREYAVEKGAKHYTAKECFNEENGAKRIYNLGNGVELEILYNYYYFNTSDDENNYSVCTMLNYNDHHFMFTGDLELEGEEKMTEYYDGTEGKKLPHVDLFKAGHHGSKTSSNECLLSKITPDICCVCCCAGGSEYTSNYNSVFPTQEFINRIAKYTDQVYVTSVYDEKELQYKSMNGNIIVSCNGTQVAIAATNNTTKLKDTEWFNETVYVDKNNNICSGKGKEDFFTVNSNEVKAVPRRVWPS